MSPVLCKLQYIVSGDSDHDRLEGNENEKKHWIISTSIPSIPSNLLYCSSGIGSKESELSLVGNRKYDDRM